MHTKEKCQIYTYINFFLTKLGLWILILWCIFVLSQTPSNVWRNSHIWSFPTSSKCCTGESDIGSALPSNCSMILFMTSPCFYDESIIAFELQLKEKEKKRKLEKSNSFGNINQVESSNLQAIQLLTPEQQMTLFHPNHSSAIMNIPPGQYLTAFGDQPIISSQIVNLPEQSHPYVNHISTFVCVWHFSLYFFFFFWSCNFQYTIFIFCSNF